MVYGLVCVDSWRWVLAMTLYVRTGLHWCRPSYEHRGSRHVVQPPWYWCATCQMFPYDIQDYISHRKRWHASYDMLHTDLQTSRPWPSQKALVLKTCLNRQHPPPFCPARSPSLALSLCFPLFHALSRTVSHKHSQTESFALANRESLSQKLTQNIWKKTSNRRPIRQWWIETACYGKHPSIFLKCLSLLKVLIFGWVY